MEDIGKYKEEATKESMNLMSNNVAQDTSLMPLEEFETHIKTVKKENEDKLIEYIKAGGLVLRDYSGVNKFKSIRRAIRRGHVSIYGEVYPHRPFKNIKAKKGSLTYNKKRIYEQIKHKNTKCN